MADDFHPCPSCPQDFTSADALAGHQRDCRPAAAKERSPRPRTGDALEDLIEDSVAALAKSARLHLEHVPPPVKILQYFKKSIIKGQILKKGGLDFVGHLEGWHLTFDAKSTTANRFPLSMIEEHQATTAKRRHEEGALAFFLVEFTKVPNGPRYFILPWHILAPWWKAYNLGGQVASISFQTFTGECIELQRAGKVIDLVGGIRRLRAQLLEVNA